ncbi:hypothetical protein CLV54_1377 [Compostimonas suwonensis]|uniref:Uncharacterized protein n=1 Tax=Compostimonas suwonensis TaxID=1048394 RepID=A0A2M9C069_9MICO|nr:hypothetical protein CLV54_1377 [Compostimonas suwonensis]
MILAVTGIVWSAVTAPQPEAAAALPLISQPPLPVPAQDAAAAPAAPADPAAPPADAPAPSDQAPAAPDEGQGQAQDPAHDPAQVFAGQDPQAPATPPATAPNQLPRTGEWNIRIATRGYQTELDRCQWVRMDVGAVAPIVGAHNYCDGAIVLDMQPGDLVHLAGTDLDGEYLVTGSRDAHAGDRADTATAGLVADVILQTCYWGGDPLRLVTLVTHSS